MRVRRPRSIVLGSACLVALALGPTRLGAQTPLSPGSWEFFEWFMGVGPVEGNGFTIASATDQIRIRVTDLGFTGDAFNIFVNGAAAGTTPSVPPGINTGALSGDAAWADSRLSSLELLLDPGSYLITVAVRETAPGFTFGEGAIRGDLVPDGPPTVIPEPATLLLVLPGLVATALVARRRRA